MIFSIPCSDSNFARNLIVRVRDAGLSKQLGVEVQLFPLKIYTDTFEYSR